MVKTPFVSMYKAVTRVTMMIVALVKLYFILKNLWAVTLLSKSKTYFPFENGWSARVLIAFVLLPIPNPS